MNHGETTKPRPGRIMYSFSTEVFAETTGENHNLMKRFFENLNRLSSKGAQMAKNPMKMPSIIHHEGNANHNCGGYHFPPSWLEFEKIKITSVSKEVEKLEPCALLVGM